MGLRQVDVGAAAPDRLAALLSPRRRAELVASGARLRAALGGQALVCIGMSRTGTGVADLTEAVVTASRGLGIQARWLLLESGRDAGADTAFRRLAERVRHAINGLAGMGDLGQAAVASAGGLAGPGGPGQAAPGPRQPSAPGEPSAPEQLSAPRQPQRISAPVPSPRPDPVPRRRSASALYRQTAADVEAELRDWVRPGDVVVCAGVATAALVPLAKRAGAIAVWACRSGSETSNQYTREGWEFLRPFLTGPEGADAFVLSLPAAAPRWLPSHRLYTLPPLLDPLSAKNQPMEAATVRAVLGHVGLLRCDEVCGTAFVRRDGSPGRVDRHADILQTGGPAPAEAPLVLSTTRWEARNDPLGLLACFADEVAPHAGAHLVLAGPAVHGVPEDPDAPQMFADCVAWWRRLPHALRTRVHLACLPVADPEENSAIVNALQRHAAVVVDKSLAEGDGLAIVEAMYKGRPVVAGAVGVHAEHIRDEWTGLLADPRDPAEFGKAIRRLLDDPTWASQLGAAARRHTVADFLGDRHLAQWSRMLVELRADVAARTAGRPLCPGCGDPVGHPPVQVGELDFCSAVCARTWQARAPWLSAAGDRDAAPAGSTPAQLGAPMRLPAEQTRATDTDEGA
jgi:trehalose synthase